MQHITCTKLFNSTCTKLFIALEREINHSKVEFFSLCRLQDINEVRTEKKSMGSIFLRFKG